MPIRLACSCGKTLQVKDELAGKKIRCPVCQSVQLVPGPQLEPVLDELEIVPEDEPVPDDPADEEEEVVQPRKKKKKRARKRSWFGNVNAGMGGGVLMVVIAVVWFVVGLAGGLIFYYPPVLLAIGFIAIAKGLVSRD